MTQKNKDELFNNFIYYLLIKFKYLLKVTIFNFFHSTFNNFIIKLFIKYSKVIKMGKNISRIEKVIKKGLRHSVFPGCLQPQY